MINDSKSLETEPEDPGPLLETYKTSIITHWIAPKIPTKHSCTYTTGFKQLFFSIIKDTTFSNTA